MKRIVNRIFKYATYFFAVVGFGIMALIFLDIALSSIKAALILTPRHRVEVENATNEVLAILVLSVNDRSLSKDEQGFKKWLSFNQNPNWFSNAMVGPGEKHEFTLPSYFDSRIGIVEIIACTQMQITPLWQGVYISFVCWPWKNGKWEWRDSKGDWPLHHEVISKDDLHYIDASYLKKHTKSPVIEPLMELLLRASVSFNEQSLQ